MILTGRTRTGVSSLESLEEEIKERGGSCEIHVVDHACAKSTRKFFEDVSDMLRREERRLDYLVNNAYAAVGFIMKSLHTPCWKKGVERPEGEIDSDPALVWDLINGTGLKNNYVCAMYAMRLMEADGNGGVIVNITSWAGMVSLFDPVYSVGKAGVDRLSAELAQNAPEGVRVFSLCPGFVGTEALLSESKRKEADPNEGVEGYLPKWNCETPLFVGRVLAAILERGEGGMIDGMNGRVVIAAEAADKLGVCDETGFTSLSFRSVRCVLMNAFPALVSSPIRHVIPRTLYAPWWAVRAFNGALKYWN